MKLLYFGIQPFKAWRTLLNHRIGVLSLFHQHIMESNRYLLSNHLISMIWPVNPERKAREDLLINQGPPWIVGARARALLTNESSTKGPESSWARFNYQILKLLPNLTTFPLSNYSKIYIKYKLSVFSIYFI